MPNARGEKCSAPTDQVNDGRGQRRADRLRKVGEVSRGIEKRPEGRFVTARLVTPRFVAKSIMKFSTHQSNRVRFAC